MLNLETVSPEEYTAFAKDLMWQCKELGTHEEASQHIAKQIYEQFTTDGQPTFALVRIFRMTRVELLPEELRDLLDEDEQYAMALTGTYGMDEVWCDRRQSVGHKVIPLRQAV